MHRQEIETVQVLVYTVAMSDPWRILKRIGQDSLS